MKFTQFKLKCRNSKSAIKLLHVGILRTVLTSIVVLGFYIFSKMKLNEEEEEEIETIVFVSEGLTSLT